MLVSPQEFPTDVGFVELVHGAVRERLCRLGSFAPSTLFFQIPFCPMSGACGGIVTDYEHRCYYQFLCTTRGVIEGLADVRVVLEHEQHEIRDTTQKATSSIDTPAFTTVEAEKARHVPEMEALTTKFGAEMVDRTGNELDRLARAYPRIPLEVLLFWLAVYVAEQHVSLSIFRPPMTETMLSPEQRKQEMVFLNKVRDWYSGSLPWDVWKRLYLAAAKSQIP